MKVINAFHNGDDKKAAKAAAKAVRAEKVAAFDAKAALAAEQVKAAKDHCHAVRGKMMAAAVASMLWRCPGWSCTES